MTPNTTSTPEIPQEEKTPKEEEPKKEEKGSDSETQPPSGSDSGSRSDTSTSSGSSSGRGTGSTAAPSTYVAPASTPSATQTQNVEKTKPSKNTNEVRILRFSKSNPENVSHKITKDYNFRKDLFYVINRENLIKDSFALHKPSYSFFSPLLEIDDQGHQYIQSDSHYHNLKQFLLKDGLIKQDQNLDHDKINFHFTKSSK